MENKVITTPVVVNGRVEDFVLPPERKEFVATPVGTFLVDKEDEEE